MCRRSARQLVAAGIITLLDNYHMGDISLFSRSGKHGLDYRLESLPTNISSAIATLMMGAVTLPQRLLDPSPADAPAIGAVVFPD